MDYDHAIEFIVDRRNDDLAAADAFFKQLLRDDAEFRDAELAVRAAELDFARGKITREALEKLTKVRDGVVKRKGYGDKLAPPPHCDKCGDTGRVGSAYCDCVRRLAISSATDDMTLPVRSFGEFNPALFPAAKREFVQKTAEALATIAAKGADARIRNINLIGRPGTGKTFLASCFVGSALENGKTAVFITAFALVRRALSYHLGDDRNALTPVLDCDVLAIDDLGTESMLRNVTAEYLYLIINERQLAGKTTLITSNLTLDELAVRYGERLVSRLFDKKLCYSREFDFEDIRKLKL